MDRQVLQRRLRRRACKRELGRQPGAAASTRHQRGQNSELFGTTLDGLLQILRFVQLKPYVPMERALLLYARNATPAPVRLPVLRLNFPAEQKSRNRLCTYL